MDMEMSVAASMRDKIQRIADLEADLARLREENNQLQRNLEGAAENSEIQGRHYRAIERRLRKENERLRSSQTLKRLDELAAEILPLRESERRLQEYVEARTYCPCCGETKECVAACTFNEDHPDLWEVMSEARAALAQAEQQGYKGASTSCPACDTPHPYGTDCPAPTPAEAKSPTRRCGAPFWIDCTWERRDHSSTPAEPSDRECGWCNGTGNQYACTRGEMKPCPMCNGTGREAIRAAMATEET